MDINNLTKLIQSYKYNQFNIIKSDDINVNYNPKSRTVEIESFYEHDVISKSGTCSELMNSTYIEIKDKYPELHVTRVTGNEPSFYKQTLFSKKPSNSHCYLLLSEQDLMDGKYYSDEKKEIKTIKKNNPLIFDPSFQKILPLAESKYSLERLMNEGCNVAYSNNLILKHDEGTPIAISSSGEMVYLMANLNTPNVIEIGLQKKGSNVKQYNLDSSILLEKLSNDDEILKVIDLFKNVPQFETYKTLEENNNIVVG